MNGSVRRRQVAIFLGVATLAAAAFVAVSVAGAASEDAERALAGPPLVVNIGTGPATLDPRDATSFFDTLLVNFYVRLVTYGSKSGPNGTRQFDSTKIEPYLAKSWKVTNGGKTYTFKLRTGLRFPSGKPVDAAAVKWSFERSQKGIGSYFIQNGIPGNLLSVAAPRPDTAVMTLKQPDPEILQGWAQPAASIVDRTVVEAKGDKYLGSAEAGAGPFSLVSYQPNQRLVMATRPSYWSWIGKTAPASRITLNFVNSDSTLLLQARSGAADVTIGLSKRSVASLRSNAAVKVIANPTAITEQMLLPWDKPPFDNQRFRQALISAVPYRDILSKVAYGYGRLFYGPLLPTMRFYNASLSAPVRFDLARAKQLIAQSGVQTPVNVQLTIDEGNAIHEQIATILQGLWRQLGVNITVQKLAPADYAGALFGNKVQSAIRYDGPGVIDAGYYLGYDMRTQVVGIGKNISAMSMPGADRLLDTARKSLNPAVRQKNYNAIARVWRVNSPKIVFYTDVATTILSRRVKTFTYIHEPDMQTWGK